jgi:sugar phosphate isomerase/epimerase
MTNRREFLQSSFGLLAVACARAGGTSSGATVMSSAGAMNAASVGAGRLPIGFSTLGCPKWPLAQAIDFAATHGFASIELRGILDKMDLTQVPELTTDLAATRKLLAAHDLRVVTLGASAEMHLVDPAKRAAALDEGRRFIDLAERLGAPYVRVFGNVFLPTETREATLGRVASGMRELGDYAKGKKVTVVIESHGDFTDSPTLLELMKRADSPQVAILWDAHHTFVSGKEQPEDTVRQIGPYIRHTHLKDSVPAGNDRRYVLTGTGEVPVKRQIAALAGIGYRGFYNFEWEKRWHPEIEEPEVAFAHYATVVAGYLHDAGIAPRSAQR